jgi:hypothetical protein
MESNTGHTRDKIQFVTRPSIPLESKGPPQGATNLRRILGALPPSKEQTILQRAAQSVHSKHALAQLLRWASLLRQRRVVIRAGTDILLVVFWDWTDAY